MWESSTVASSASETNSGNSDTSLPIPGYRCGDAATCAMLTMLWLSGDTRIATRATCIGCLPISAEWMRSMHTAPSVCVGQPGEFSYTLRCGHTLHLKCLEYARSVRAECPGEKILSVCPICSDPITDDLEKVVFVHDVWPEHMWWWPDKPQGFIEAADNGLRAAEGAYLAASAAVRASFATLNRARAGSLTPAQKQQVNELLEAMMRGDVLM